MYNAELLELIQARQEVLLEQNKNLDLRDLINGDEDFRDDYLELCWRFDELAISFASGDVHLMRSCVKLSSRQCAEIESKL